MKKKFFAAVMLVALTVSGAITYANVMPKESEVLAESQGYRTAYKVTGDRVIYRSGPGKQYGQVRDLGGRPVYFNKGDILLPGNGGVRNGFRNVGIPNDELDGWVSVKYLKKVKWNDGYVY